MSLFANAKHSFTDIACRKGDLLLYSGVSFELKSGELVWLKGVNGVGKSTLMRQLAGLLALDWGQVTWDPAVIQSDEAPLHYLGHDNALDAELTVEQSLNFWADIHGASADRRAIAAEALRLDSFKNTPCQFLSSGQKRRTALARLLLSRKPVWLLDEPFVGLDQGSVSRVCELLEDQLEANGAVLIISHQDFPPVSDRARLFELEPAQ